MLSRNKNKIENKKLTLSGHPFRRKLRVSDAGIISIQMQDFNRLWIAVTAESVAHFCARLV